MWPNAAGADIGEISELGAKDTLQQRYLEDLCQGMKAIRKPVVAAVEGMAVHHDISRSISHPCEADQYHA